MSSETKRGIVMEALKLVNATTSAAAISAKDLLEKAANLNGWNLPAVSTELSHINNDRRYRRYVKRISVDGSAPTRYKYYLDVGNSTHFNASNTQDKQEKVIDLIPRRRKGNRTKTSHNSDRPYKLEVSGDDVLLSTNISSAELATIMTAVLNKRG